MIVSSCSCCRVGSCVGSCPYTDIAGFGGVDYTLAKWMDEKQLKKTGDPELSVSERVEFEQLRREKREWILEREILKKAMAFWVKESNG